MTATIRLATGDDAEQIQAIYAPYVRDTAISFEVEPPSVDEMRQRVSDVLPRMPWLVCERAGAVLGYAYAGKYRVRAAYQWSVDVSVYIDAHVHRSGIGRGLYTALLALLELQGFYNAYAGITLPNPASVGLHESLGFTPVGVYRHVGYKLGAWHDVGWWQRALRTHAADPKPPAELNAARASPAWEAALAAGMRMLRV
jgi:L-amino acid N-acyltransferase YncA